jgi:diacylglycerol kinase family enzyme
VIASALFGRHSDEASVQVFKFRKLEVKTKPRVRVYADNYQVGRTPATITAETSALKVLLPH